MQRKRNKERKKERKMQDIERLGVGCYGVFSLSVPPTLGFFIRLRFGLVSSFCFVLSPVPFRRSIGGGCSCFFAAAAAAATCCCSALGLLLGC
jgi:hypothetical protein